MNAVRIPAAVATVAFVSIVGIALAAQDRYALQVPSGLGFLDFRGYPTV